VSCFAFSALRNAHRTYLNVRGASLSVTIGVSIGVNPTSASASPSVSLPSGMFTSSVSLQWLKHVLLL